MKKEEIIEEIWNKIMIKTRYNIIKIIKEMMIESMNEGIKIGREQFAEYIKKYLIDNETYFKIFEHREISFRKLLEKLEEEATANNNDLTKSKKTIVKS